MLQISLVFMSLISTATCLNCYSCTSNEPGCTHPTQSTRINECSNSKQVCYTETIFPLQNTSFSGNPTVFERKCFEPLGGVCDLNDKVLGPCFKTADKITCFHCCSAEQCNTKLPRYNNARQNKVLVVMLLSLLMASVKALY